MPRTRRSRMQREPWGPRGWAEAPNALTSAEVALAMAAPVAPPPSLPDDLRSFQVGVVARRRGGFDAYTRAFCADWPEVCVHLLSATSGKEAKKMAVEAHVRFCLNRQEG